LELPLDTALARRLIWNVLPAALVVGAVYMTVAGKAGLLARHTLKQRVYTTEQAVTSLQEDNEHKRARIAALKRDPEALQRAAADELLVAPAGAVVYRFPADE
jgi:cell division protein FtsB